MANLELDPNCDEDCQWLEHMEAQFKKIAGEDNKIDLKEFKGALKIKESFFATRFFELFDNDKSGAIDLEELMRGLRLVIKGDYISKLKFLFDVYDADGNGSIDEAELRTVIQSCVDESSLSVSEADMNKLISVMFQSTDEDKSGLISFDELKTELDKHPGVMENLTISAAHWLRPPKPKKNTRACRYFTLKYWRNNRKEGVLFLLYFFINICLFALNCFLYRKSNVYIIIARGCGMCLNFNCAFILMTMLRKTITYIRTFKNLHFLPLDQHIEMHKLTGIMIAVFTVIHTLAHIGNAVVVAEDFGVTVWEFIFTTKANIGWVLGFAPLSGVILDVILIVMIICSMPFIRRSGHFQVFYWTHILYVPFWILCILHATNFWYWFIIPGIIFIIESLNRSKYIKKAAYGATYITNVYLLPYRVIHLVISRPPKWRYRPGDYVFIQIPAIAKYEWHPFTISSAPEQEGTFWLHIRSAGHWTNKLYDYFDSYDPNTYQYGTFNKGFGLDVMEAGGTIEEGTYRRLSSTGNTDQLKTTKPMSKIVRVKIYIDGPFGTSAREIFDTEHAVLVGSGIGVTPFASILQSILHRFQSATRTCPKCQHSFYDQRGPGMKIKRVDFIWINRDQKNFEWFVRMLTDIEVEQANYDKFGRIIHMHMYMTSALSKTDMKGLGLQMALELLHTKEHRDVLTGLRTRTHAGRPNFDELFGEIKQNKAGKVKVFLCGPQALAKDLKEKSDKFGFDFTKENF
ncbi:hypothetical protein LOTGIDRAFT_159226 [Lottia gigantea]|uniref:NADPH oxidase 5 n=1 Tax=Lottia gigantea TaxID=225164 RepID=V4AMP5_LOTGI|nr:hypothetical protein LOTGIDRAFT_159226 [Lottia gigantea]ESO98417.1 hypothetical protein LOTGIDRAFT_159226 [Lottia gigantea]